MESGAQPGNNNATKNKPWIKALNRAIAQGNPDRLRNIAEKLLTEAEAGESWAIKEVGDRLDGKAAQSIHATVENIDVVNRNSLGGSEPSE